MKQVRWFETAALCTAVFMGFALNACNNEDDDMIPDDEFGMVQSALSSAKVTKGAVSVRKGPGAWYERIGGLHQGNTVEVIKEQAGWLNIKYGDTEGWIYRPHTSFASSTSSVTCTRETADFIRDNFPNGYNILFAYNGSDSRREFHSQANKFSAEYHPINIESGTLKKDVFLPVDNYSAFKKGISNTGLAVVNCLANNPREGFDDSKCSQIKNLTVMTHGTVYGLRFVDDGGSGNFLTSHISEFSSYVYGYLNNSELRVQLYACNTAHNDKKIEDNWYDRLESDRETIKQKDPFKYGKGSFAQLLSEAMGPDATVFGHTTSGHLSGNRAARCYGKLADGADHGKHMFDVYFPQSFVAEQSKRLKDSEDNVRKSMYDYYVLNFDDKDSGGKIRARDSFIDPEGKGQKMRDGWLAGKTN